MPTTADYLNLSQVVYTTGGIPVAPPGWTLMTQSNGTPLFESISSSGMQAAAFKNTTTGEIVIAYEGTNLSNETSNQSMLTGQLSADSAIVDGTPPQANLDALSFAARVADAAGGSPVYVTGHSLGGEEAEYVQNAANAANSPFSVGGGTVFGAPGVPQLVANGNSPNFTSYIDYGDAVGNYVASGAG